ncbi:MAG TPA: hypothetical protein VGK32_18505 [Vicinamibacterales bacterium]|jgi:hypothetical protein
MTVVCRRCNTVVVERFTARCHRCLKNILRTGRDVGSEPEAAGAGEKADTLVTRIAMRMTRYSASDSYYAQSLTVLRLDRPAVTTERDQEVETLAQILPPNRRPSAAVGGSEGLMSLVRRLRDAEVAGDTERTAQIRRLIAEAALGNQTPTRPVASASASWTVADPDIERGISESLAFRQNVTSRLARTVASEAGGAGAALLADTDELCRRLGIAEVRLVEDLPVITATFGYTRRSFEPTYEELGSKELPTELRPFPSLDERAARRILLPEATGTVPILARESEHEGVFLSLDHDRVIKWLAANGVNLGAEEGTPPIARVLRALEPVDRYSDRIWDCPTRRFVFGVVHTLSHVAMRAASRFAGVERTSISEYIFLPLMGTVIFDNSSTFRLGGMESMVKYQLPAFLSCLSREALDCLYDPDCLDHRGACHGCIHSPEISCRVFNHGLSRSFLFGGHAPWADVASDQRIVGYWQV